MQAPKRSVHEQVADLAGVPPAGQHASVEDVATPTQLHGDAHVAITAPFFPEGDPLASQHRCTEPSSRDLDGQGVLVRSELPMNVVMRGTLTFQQPAVDELTSFEGGDAWLQTVVEELNGQLTEAIGRPVYDTVELMGMLFPDGYGSVAVTLRLPDGWSSERRSATLQAVGVAGREVLAQTLRAALLPPLQRMLRRCGAGGDAIAVLPYFNLTYAGSTDHPKPGRSTLHDGLRHLVYPDSALPLTSRSPWADEYLYTGYAYHLLASRDPVPSLRKLTLLLLVLNASYSRLARFAAAADQALRSAEYYSDVAWLAQTERRLRSEYQSLITPTFSFDHHALSVRDAVLESWSVPKLQARTDDLISMLRSAVEFRLAEDQARRIRRLNLFVVVLTALSVIPTVESLAAIIGLFTG